MSAIKDKMIDIMNADREAEAAKAEKVVRICKHCSYFYNEIQCPDSKGENDTCIYFSL
jgi:hypothetical protein